MTKTEVEFDFLFQLFEQIYKTRQETRKTRETGPRSDLPPSLLAVGYVAYLGEAAVHHGVHAWLRNSPRSALSRGLYQAGYWTRCARQRFRLPLFLTPVANILRKQGEEHHNEHREEQVNRAEAWLCQLGPQAADVEKVVLSGFGDVACIGWCAVFRIRGGRVELPELSKYLQC